MREIRVEGAKVGRVMFGVVALVAVAMALAILWPRGDRQDVRPEAAREVRHDPPRADPPRLVQPEPPPPQDKPTPPDLHSLWRSFGAQGASLGPLFGGLALGSFAPSPGLPPRLGFDVFFEKNGARIDGVTITVNDPETCTKLGQRLARLWGPAVDGSWRASSRDRYARFDASFETCSLRFIRTVTAERWLNRSRDSVVPLWALGKPAGELAAALVPLEVTSFGDTTWNWRDVSMDGEGTMLSAHVHDGRVTGIEASADRILARILALFGRPDAAAPADTVQSWSWNRTPRIVFSRFGSSDPYTIAPDAPPSDGLGDSIRFEVQ